MTLRKHLQGLGYLLVGFGAPLDTEGPVSLSPQFDPEQHETYVRLVMGALNEARPDIPRNLAVTGHYGSG